MNFQLSDTEEASSSSMTNSFSYFENKNCIFYPCHKLDHINCLFCFCPLYHDENCGGKYVYTNGVKDCSDCIFPHIKENYMLIIQRLSGEDCQKGK